MRLRERIAWTALALTSIIGIVTQYAALSGDRPATAYACGFVRGYFHAVDKDPPAKIGPLCDSYTKAAISAGFHVGPEQGL